MDTDPIAVGLKFGFLAVLYLFLLWVSRSALKELRSSTAPAPEATGFHDVGPGAKQQKEAAAASQVPRSGRSRVADRRDHLRLHARA